MSKLLDIESPVMSFLNFIGKLFILNILWLICCLPIVTVGASTSAMYSVMYKVVMDKDQYLIKDFFIYFAKNFKKSTILWLIVLLIGILFSFNLRYALSDDGSIHNIYFIISVIGLAAAVILFIYVFAIQARFENTIKSYLINSFILLVYCPIKFILLSIIWITPLLISYNNLNVLKYTGFIWLFCGFALQFYLATRILLSVFKKAAVVETAEDNVDEVSNEDIEKAYKKEI